MNKKKRYTVYQGFVSSQIWHGSTPVKYKMDPPRTPGSKKDLAPVSAPFASAPTLLPILIPTPTKKVSINRSDIGPETLLIKSDLKC